METQKHGKILGFQCETDLPIQTIDRVQSQGDSDSHSSSPARSPESREESPEVLISGTRTLSAQCQNSYDLIIQGLIP